MKKAVIVGSGNVDSASLLTEAEGALLISADGGLEAIKRLGLTPDLILGDMDSVSGDTLKSYEDKGILPKLFPVEKDLTDTAIAAHEALLMGASEIVFFGATSDERLDHTLANIGLLKTLCEQGIRARIVAPFYVAEAFSKPFSIEGQKGKTVSLLSLTDETKGVTLRGFYYPLSEEILTFGSSRGVSNIVTGECAKVHFSSGTLLAMINKTV